MLTNFLIYRQLDDNVAQGEKRKTRKHSQGALEPGVSRCLVGSLTDSYNFKNDGLLKKAIIVTLDDVPYRLIAYYSMNDAEHLKRPRDDSRLQDLRIRDTLLKQAKFASSSIDDTGDKELDQANRLQNLGLAIIRMDTTLGRCILHYFLMSNRSSLFGQFPAKISL